MSPRWLFFPSAAGSDWDTYAISVSAEATLPGWVDIDPFDPTGTAFEPGDFREGFNGFQIRDGNTSSSFVTNVPYIAIWNESGQRWTVHAHAVDGGSSYQAYNKTTFEPTGATLPASGDDFRVVGLSEYTAGAVDNWNNYS